jgi:hypothetical protein
MKAYLLKEGQKYNQENGMYWQESNLSVEETIKQFSGKRTIQLMWNDDVNNFNCSVVLPSANDILENEERIANIVTSYIKNKLS